MFVYSNWWPQHNDGSSFSNNALERGTAWKEKNKLHKTFLFSQGSYYLSELSDEKFESLLRNYTLNLEAFSNSRISYTLISWTVQAFIWNHLKSTLGKFALPRWMLPAYYEPVLLHAWMDGYHVKKCQYVAFFFWYFTSFLNSFDYFKSINCWRYCSLLIVLRNFSR